MTVDPIRSRAAPPPVPAAHPPAAVPGEAPHGDAGMSGGRDQVELSSQARAMAAAGGEPRGELQLSPERLRELTFADPGTTGSS